MTLRRNPFKKEFKQIDRMELWRRRIRVARKIRDKELKDYDKLKGFYEGFQWWEEDTPIMEDRTTVNLVFSGIKKELAHLYFKNPSPIVNAKRAEFELNAYASQELLKYYVKKNLDVELKKQIRLTLLDAKFALGCCKVIYTPLFEHNPSAGDPIEVGYDDFGDLIFLTDEEGKIVGQSNDILISELYYVERISPKEILIDPECKNFAERAKWIAQEIIKPLDYMKKSKLYKNTSGLEANVDLSETLKTTSEKEIRKLEEERVRFYEIYDMEEDKIIVIADGYDKFLRDDKVIAQPFIFLKFNEKLDEFYAVPDLRITKPLQEEINVGRSQMITHARRAARKYYFEEGSIDETEINKAKEPEDMTFFGIKDFARPPKPLELAVQDPSIYTSLMQSRIDYNDVSGDTENERGTVERRKTLGEAQLIEGHASVRRADKQSLVADFIKEIYTKLLQLMQHTLTVAQAIEIIGPTGNFWVEVEREDILGEFTMDVEVSEMKPQIPEIDKRELSEFMFALANLLTAILQNPLMLQIMNVQGLIKELAKGYPTLDVGKILNMAVTPEQIIKQAQEQQKQQGGKGAT